MTLPTAITRDPVYRKALRLCQSISEHRFALTELAYEAREENHYIEYDGRRIWWSEIIALANGVDVRRVQEWAQVGEFISQYHPSTMIYSRVSVAVRFRGVICSADLLAMIADEDNYPTVESLQSALIQIAYGIKEYTPLLITRAIRRAMMGGSKLLSLNGDLPPEIRGDITAGVASFSKALETMKGLKK